MVGLILFSLCDILCSEKADVYTDKDTEEASAPFLVLSSAVFFKRIDMVKFL